MGKHEVTQPKASEKDATTEIDRLEDSMYEIRGRKVMSANRTDLSCGEFDADLAIIHGVTTARLNQHVKEPPKRQIGFHVKEACGQ